MSGEEPLRTFTLRKAQGTDARKFEALKFRERLPGLEKAATAVKIERKERARASEEKFVVAVDGKRYLGAREAVGTSAFASSCYVALRVQDGVMTMMPLEDQFSFRPEPTYTTIGLDEAEELMEKSDKRSAMRDRKFDKIAKRDEDGDPKAAGASSSSAGGRGGGGGGGRGGGGGGGDGDFDGDFDDDFDDGAGPNWAAGAERDEDGNDGLDVEDDNEFDDDEDDSFAASKARDLQFGCVSTDDAELAFHESVEESRATAEDRQRREMEEALEKEGDNWDAALEDEEEDGLGAADGSEWARESKHMLAEERKRKRREDDEDDDDDDDPFDDQEDTAEALRREADRAAPPAEEESSIKKGGASGAGGKRALSPADKDKPLDRAKMAKIRESAAARGGQSATVAEKDLVLLLHARGKMQLKEVIAHFKPFLTSKEEKGEFIKMVSRVAYVADEGGAKVVKLKEATLTEYGLEERA